MSHYSIFISFHVNFPHRCPVDILKALFFLYGFSVLQLILEFVHLQRHYKTSVVPYFILECPL